MARGLRKICEIHEVPHEEIQLESGRALRAEDLAPYEGKGFTGFLVNVHETSTGVLYDMELISDFCRRNQLILAVDAVSSFLADPFWMGKWGVDLVLTGSQKALALPPGLSILVLGARAIARVQETAVRSMYFDLRDYLKNGERGQTPFTPAVGVLLQLHKRLTMIEEKGLEAEQARIRCQAEDFRSKIKDLPFEIVSNSLSAALTPLHPTGVDKEGKVVSAHRIFEILKDEYGIWICPNGGALADTVFRVGHIGALTPEDNDSLIAAWKDMQRRDFCESIDSGSGTGTRISRYLSGKPKCTVDIGGGQCLIEYTIDLLHSRGIQDIGIVLGYEAQVIREVLADKGVSFFYNPFYDVTNSICVCMVCEGVPDRGRSADHER